MTSSILPPTPHYCYLYLVQSETGYVKIGISSNVKHRLRELQVGNHERLSLAYSLRLADRETALLLESALHARYSVKNTQGEWFSEKADQVIADIRFAVAMCRIVKSIEYVETTLVIPMPTPENIEQPLRERRHAISDAVREDDEFLYKQAVDLVRRINKASTSLLQRRLRIGFERANRIIDLMYQRGIIGEETGTSKPREVLRGTFDDPPVA